MYARASPKPPGARLCDRRASQSRGDEPSIGDDFSNSVVISTQRRIDGDGGGGWAEGMRKWRRQSVRIPNFRSSPIRVKVISQHVIKTGVSITLLLTCTATP